MPPLLPGPQLFRPPGPPPDPAPAGGPPLPPRPPRKPRAFGDVAATRAAVFDSVLEAASNLEPVSNQRHTLRLSGVSWADPDRPTRAEHKAALLEGRTLGRRLRGTWELVDNATGNVVDRRTQVVARVPHLTDLGTFVHNGTDYALIHQQRLRPGSFVRVKQNGEVDAHVNVLPGKGVSHHYVLDPDKGHFHLEVGQARVPLLPLLKAMGATPEQVREAWGDDIYAANYGADDPSALKKLAAKVLRPADLAAEPDPGRALAARFAAMELDPDVTARTLGRPFKGVTPESVLAATRKVLAVRRGEADPDDRDHMAYQRVVGPEDLLSERVARDHGRVRRALLTRASFKGSLAGVPSGALTPQLEQAILGSGLGQSVEEVNAGEILDKQSLVTRMGEGGLPSADSIPDDSRSVQPSQLGYVDLLRTPESLRAGVDTYFARSALKNPDGTVAAPFRDPRTGREVHMTPAEVADRHLALAGWRSLPFRRVPVLKGGRVTWVRPDRVDLELPHFENAFSPLANLVPLKSMDKGQRVAMGARMITQALPLADPEAPLVRGEVPGKPGRSFHEEYGPHFGALRSPGPGVVESVDRDRVRVKGPDGKVAEHELYVSHPFNRKTLLHQTPVVRPGDRVAPGQLLARSNFTDDKGHAALGRNARVAYMAWGGKNYEDAFVISESFAKDFTSEHAYQHGLEADPKVKVGKKAFLPFFPAKYGRPHLDSIGDDGVVKPGTEVEYGQPLILAVRERELSHNKVHKPGQAGYADASVLWEHHDKGVVTDVAKGKDGPVVVVKSQSVMRQGDKLSNVHGGKGVVAEVVPDHLMPHGEDGRPFDCLINPLGVISRCYDDRTEFLTGSGWKFGRDVAPEDRFVCFHPQTRNLYVLDQLEPMHVAPYRGKMLSYRNKVLDFVVTPNHRMWARCSFRGAAWQEVTAERIFRKKWAVPVAGNPVPGVRSDFALPECVLHPKDTQSVRGEIVIDAGDWAEFLGWYLAEGNTDDKVHISQSRAANPEKCARIEELLSRLPFAWHYNEKNTQYHVTSKRLCAYLKPLGLCHEKYIPEWVFGQPYEVRQRLVEAYWAGDGSVSANKQGSLFSGARSNSSRLVDDMQRLLTYQGVSACKGRATSRPGERPAWRCGRHFRAERALAPESWSEVDYDGLVYCPTVPTGYVVTRRNGRVLIAGNTNPAQVVETVLGKAAAHRGSPYVVRDFDDTPDMTAYALAELRRHGLSAVEPVHDPGTGRRIAPQHYERDPVTNALAPAEAGVLTGRQFLMKLHHTSESKGQARSSGAYTQDEAPAKGGATGSKRISLIDTNALISHGATQVLRDSAAVRGQRNDDYWLRFMQGHNPPDPKEPFAYRKFLDTLRGAGVNVVRRGTQLHVMALTRKDVDALAGDREVGSGETVRWDRGLEPVPGGLFDPAATGGHGGTSWSAMRLHEPMLNPAMEEPARRILGLTQKELEGVIAGEHTLPTGTGPQALAKALEGVNLDRELAVTRSQVRFGTKSQREAAVRKLGYLKSAKALGVHPGDWVLDRAPVLPAAYRPVSVMGSSGVPLVSDANWLYKDLAEANGNLRAASEDLGEGHTGPERLAVYHALKAVAGLGDPVSPKAKEKQVKGLLRSVFGDSPKLGTVQRKLISSTVDNVGRGVVVPNPALDMDSVGLPAGMAFQVYEKFVVRRLARRGLKTSQALREVREKTPRAREALLEEMEHRPVVVNRAPVLHKYGIMAFRPELVAGSSLHISPLVVAPFGMDFDGDAVQFHVPTDEAARREALDRMLPSRSLLSPADFKSPMYAPRQEYLAGLHMSTWPGGFSDRPPRHFRSKEDVVRAYERGDIGPTDRVVIAES